MQDFNLTQQLRIVRSAQLFLNVFDVVVLLLCIVKMNVAYQVHDISNNPDIYKKDTYLEVTDEVQAVFLADKRAEARYLRQMYNYKAHYSLDCDNGIEKAIVQHPPTPEEILEDKQLRDQLYAAVMELAV